MKIYFAGLLFSEAERNWIRSAIVQIERTAKEHQTEINIVWPYELLTQLEIKQLGSKAKLKIFSRCKT